MHCETETRMVGEKENTATWAWRYTPGILAPGRERWENRFKVIVSYTVSFQISLGYLETLSQNPKPSNDKNNNRKLLVTESGWRAHINSISTPLFSFWGSACKYVHALCPLGAHKGLKMTSGPLELRLWTVRSHHVDAGTIKPVSFTNPRSQCFQSLTHLSASI